MIVTTVAIIYLRAVELGLTVVRVAEEKEHFMEFVLEKGRMEVRSMKEILFLCSSHCSVSCCVRGNTVTPVSDAVTHL